MLVSAIVRACLVKDASLGRKIYALHLPDYRYSLGLFANFFCADVYLRVFKVTFLSCYVL